MAKGKEAALKEYFSFLRFYINCCKMINQGVGDVMSVMLIF